MGLVQVFEPNGKAHFESEIGNIRVNLENGEISTVVGSSGIRNIIDTDGNIHQEYRVNDNIRMRLDNDD